MIGGDKRVYEGRGWKVKPENTPKLLGGGVPNPDAILVAYVGCFEGNILSALLFSKFHSSLFCRCRLHFFTLPRM